MTTATAPVAGYCVDEQCECHHDAGARMRTDYVIARSKEHDYQGPSREGLPETCCQRCGRRGPKPLTIVPPQGAISIEQLAERIEKTRREYGELLNQFHKVWYECGHTWVYTTVLGVGTMKGPNDLWAYHDLIVGQLPKTIIETGTYSGGSALWFAFLMDMLGIDGRVFTIDIDDHRQTQHPKITFIGGSSVDPKLSEAVLAEVQHPLMVVLDSDHSADHVRKELELYAPALKVGEYVVVEDTNISWPGPDGDRGARGGVEDYISAHQGEFRQDIIPERNLLTMAPGGFLQRIAECPHGR